jgi:hypothetical protein
MSQSPVVEPADRIGHLEEEMNRLAAKLKAANSQISVLQMILLLAAMGLFGGGYYLITTGKLLVEGFSPAVAKSVETNEFGLYNRFGTRVVLGADDKFGLPQLIFMDLQKRYRLGIKVWPEGDGTPGMVFYDQSGMRGNFRMDEGGAAVLNLVGEGQTGGIAMAVSADGSPSLKMTDKSGKLLFQVPAATN